jgi:hypothetical protein
LGTNAEYFGRLAASNSIWSGLYLDLARYSRAAIALVAAVHLAAFPVGLTTHLDPETSKDFQAYASRVETELNQKWSDPRTPLKIESSPEDLKRVLAGEVMVHPTMPDMPVEVHDGLVHDWTGDVFIPNTTIRKVISLLQDFNSDAGLYPEVRRSRLVSKQDNHVLGYLRVERKSGMLDVVLDVYNDTRYRQVGDGRWMSEAHADRIQQVQDAGTAHEKILPQGVGYGFLWRMSNYWIFQARDGGVLIECRNLSLSRSVPSSVAWVVNPIVRDQAKVSMTSTLTSTRKAAEAASGKG